MHLPFPSFCWQLKWVNGKMRLKHHRYLTISACKWVTIAKIVYEPVLNNMVVVYILGLAFGEFSRHKYKYLLITLLSRKCFACSRGERVLKVDFSFRLFVEIQPLMQAYHCIQPQTIHDCILALNILIYVSVCQQEAVKWRLICQTLEWVVLRWVSGLPHL